MRSIRPSLGRALLALPLALLLASCGGGGGGVGSNRSQSVTETSQAPSTPRPPGTSFTPRARQPQPGDCFDTAAAGCLTNAELGRKARELAAEFKTNYEQELSNYWRGKPEFFRAFSWGPDKINADDALAHLELAKGRNAAQAPGQGVTIGFVDSGIHKQHNAFSLTSSVTERFLLNAKNEKSNEFSHGTSVASVAAGRFGIARGARIKMFAIPLVSGDGDYTPISLRKLSAADYEDSELYKYVLNQNLDILNLSISYSAGIENYRERDLRRNYSRTIGVLAQSGRQEKTILVWSAGNTGKTPGATPSSPEILAGLAARIPELRGHSIAVVSIGPDGTISDFSNRCGIAADFCIAAPGEGVGVAHSINPSGSNLWARARGTSYSAPYVSGGLAVMKQLFRGQLSNEQLASRLFSTANDDGIYADSATYGHGLLDLGAATNPWGIPGFMGSRSTATGTGTPISSSFIALGAPLGDSLPQAFASREIAAFDSLGAPFWYQTSNFTIPASGTSFATSLQHFLHPAQLRSLPATWQFSFQEDAPAMETGHLALSDGASRLTMEGPQGVTATVFQEVGDLEGLTIAWSPKTVSSLTLEAGYLKEQQSLLGSQANGAFGQFSADTLFLAAGLNTTAGRWQLAVEGELGQVSPSIGHSLLIDAVSPLTTSAFGLEATRPFANGSALSFSLRQPLRVESGIATFALPTGRNRDGVVLGEAFSASLSPSGRQLDLTAKWQFPFLAGDVSIGATRSQQPRHQHKAAPQWTVFTGYRSTW